MNSFLLYPEKTIAGEEPYPSFQDIYKDLNLNIVLKTMAQDDVFIMEHIRSVMMVPVCEPAVIAYRHAVIQDFYCHRDLIDTMYGICRRGMRLADRYKKELEQNRNKSASGAGAVISALNFTAESIALLKELTAAAEERKQDLKSEGLRRFCERFSSYPLDDFQEFHRNAMFYTTGGEGIFSIRISGGLKLDSSRLCKCRSYSAAALKNTSRKILKLYYKIVKRDTILVESEELERDLHAFVDIHMHHLMKFYQPLIAELSSFWFDFSREISFYKGVNTLQNRMAELSLPLCYGEGCTDSEQKDIVDLYELSLALYVQVRPVSNSLNDKDTVLTIITGANQGGKSTFLRSFGIAQVLLQCGMPVPASKFRSHLYSKIHTHFTRKEDAMLSRGRLEEELKRMSGIISHLSRDSLLLLNESFASTTEKEGSQIAYNVIMPLYQKRIEIMMVTHLHEFASRVYEEHLDNTEFLVAERKENGDRTFRMIPGKPHYSSYGTDLYKYMIE